MNMKIFLGFWVVFAISGISIIINTGATFTSITCATGEVVGNIKECPQCQEDVDCQDGGELDRVCQENQCRYRTCMTVADCQDSRSICEFNKCMSEQDFDFAD